MGQSELEVIAGFFERAMCPEDVFGELQGATKREIETNLKHSFRKLAKVLHPDMHAGDPAAISLAQQLFYQLEEFRVEASDHIGAGTYGQRVPIPSRVPVILKSKYVREASLVAGDIADLHLASMESGRKKNDLILKVARTPRDNDLLRSEATILDKIHSHKRFAASALSDAVPAILDSFLINDLTGHVRVNVMKRYSGFYNAEFIRHKFPLGVDGRTIAWMWKRMLVLLDWVHKIGFIHGAVLPPHVMFYPDNDGKNVKIDPQKHTVRLVDWCYAVAPKDRTRLSAWVPALEDFYAPEILAKKELGPWTDLYMGAKTMLYLAGGDPAKNGFPDSIPKEIVASLSECLRKDSTKRPQDAGEYFEKFYEAVRKAYGANRWHEFAVPGI